MGVRTLTGILQQAGHSDVWTDFGSPSGRVHEESSLYVVVDGTSLVYHLYFQLKLNSLCGGQYLELKNEVAAVVEELRSCGHSPVFLFDGSVPAEKTGTVLGRERGYLSRVRRANETARGGGFNALKNLAEDFALLPLLSFDAAKSALLERRVPFYTCEGEADAMVASLCMSLGDRAIVLSQDSDYCIFPLSGGYAPLNGFAHGSDGISFVLYSRKAMAASFGISEPLVPMLGCLLGNDYLTDDMLFPIHQHITSTHPGHHSLCGALSAFLSKFQTCNEALEALRHRCGLAKDGPTDQALCYSLNYYGLVGEAGVPLQEHDDIVRLKQLVLGDVAYPCGRAVPMDACWGNTKDVPCRLRSVVRDRTFFCRAVVEDMSTGSAWTASKRIRSLLYGLVMSTDKNKEGKESLPSITEYCRNGLEYSGSSVSFPVPARTRCDLLAMSLSERRFAVSCILLGEEPSVRIATIPHLGLAYWAKNAFNYSHVFILALSLWLSGARRLRSRTKGKGAGHRKARTKHGEWNSMEGFSIQMIHRAAEWQTIVLTLSILNDYLDCPFDSSRAEDVWNGSEIFAVIAAIEDHGPFQDEADLLGIFDTDGDSTTDNDPQRIAVESALSLLDSILPPGFHDGAPGRRAVFRQGDLRSQQRRKKPKNTESMKRPKVAPKNMFDLLSSD